MRSGRCFIGVTLFLPRGVIGLLPARAATTSMTPLLSNAMAAPVREGRWRDLRVAAARRAPPQLLGKILYLERITVSFDGFKALDGLTLYVDPGELRCIIGRTAPARPP
jgi:hypothetical protein